MPKKIYDIVPPKMARKIEHTIAGSSSAKTKGKKRKQERKSPLLWVFATGGVALVALLAFLFFALPKAVITISPKMETLTLSDKITADTKAATVNFDKKIIPAQLVTQEQEMSQDFEATGSASNDGKATGTIKVYNKVTPAAAVTLKAGTHFLSDSGKYFLILEKIVIPAMQKGTPGSISVKVEAEESGPAYNIGPSKFSIPKLSGTAEYYTIYADSQTAMSGGMTGKIKKVTNEDVAEAKNTLSDALLAKAQDLIKGKISSDDMLLEGAVSKEIIDAKSSVAAGTVAEKFNETVKIKVSAFVVKKKDLEKFVADYISSKLADGKAYLAESVKADYKEDSVDIVKGNEVINITLTANTYQDINGGDISNKAIGKSAPEIQQMVEDSYGDAVARTDVKLWPFWVNRAPKNRGKVTVEFNFQQ